MNEEPTHVVYCQQCGTALLQTPDPGGKAESWPCYNWRDPVTRKRALACPGCGATTAATAFAAEPMQLRLLWRPYQATGKSDFMLHIGPAAPEQPAALATPDVAL